MVRASKHFYPEERRRQRRYINLHERINYPEVPTSVAEVVEDIKREERRVRQARKDAARAPQARPDPCPAAPGAAHHWVYPPPGVHRAIWCKHGGCVKSA